MFKMFTFQQFIEVQKPKEKKKSEYVKKPQCLKLSRSTQSGGALNQ